jgi:hypothetical protein
MSMSLFWCQRGMASGGVTLVKALLSAVAEDVSDVDEVDPGLKQMHRLGVSEGVRR